MAFYLLTWTYFNDVNVGRNKFSIEKNPFYWQRQKKMKQNWEKQKKKKKGKIKYHQRSDFSENEIPNLNFLKPFKFEPKRNIRDINTRGRDDEKKGAEYKNG